MSLVGIFPDALTFFMRLTVSEIRKFLDHWKLKAHSSEGEHLVVIKTSPNDQHPVFMFLTDKSLSLILDDNGSLRSNREIMDNLQLPDNYPRILPTNDPSGLVVSVYKGCGILHIGER